MNLSVIFIMKTKNWCFMRLLSFIIFLSGCGGTAMNQDAKQVSNFKWYAVATAPREYPMEVIRGTSFYKEMNSGVQIPSGGTLTTGWGESASAYVGGDEIPPLPDRVQVVFFPTLKIKSMRLTLLCLMTSYWRNSNSNYGKRLIKEITPAFYWV